MRERLNRFDEMLDHIPKKDSVEGSFLQVRRQKISRLDLEAQFLPREARRELTWFNSQRVPTPPFSLREEKPDPAPEVEKPPRWRREPFDPLENHPRCLALPRLFIDIAEGLRDRVGAFELFASRKRIELHVFAGLAAHDVGERGAEPIGRRNQALHSPVAGDGKVRAEVGPSTDCTLGTDRSRSLRWHGSRG